MTLANVSGVTNVALNGYDPVSFFANDSKPTNGNFQITATYDGVTYYFVNDQNKAAFEANPEQYVPQMGGFCAYGVAKWGLFPADLATAQVYKGKLYLNLNSDMLALFNQDLDGAISKAEKNWEDLNKDQKKEIKQ